MAQPNGSIRDLVLQVVGELGLANPVPHGQTILLRNRLVVGQRFNFDGVSAVWFADEGQIKFHDGQGRLLRVLDVGQADDKRAA